MLEDLSYWHWWVVAAVLIILEVFAPGAFFLWLGIAAGIVGGIVLIAPSTSWEIQILTFSLLSIVSTVAWRTLFQKGLSSTDQPTLNRRGEQYIGRRFTLDAPIKDGMGKIRVDDSTWKVRGENCEAGTQVEVTGVDGTILLVDCKSNTSD